MNRPITFTTPNGDEMAILPLEDYERLVEAAEDAADARAYDAAKALTASGDGGLPIDFMKRLIAGESPLRVWREYRGLSTGELAQAADVDPVLLLELEERRSEGSLASMKRLAEALELPIDELA